jgi:hypothetical protein
MTDAVTLLRELRPETSDVAPDEATLERLLLGAAEPSLRRRRVARPLAAAAGIAALALTAVAVAPTGRDTPSVIARAAAALSQPDTILHFKAVARFPGRAPEQIESWQTTSGRQQRSLEGSGGFESADDQDARTFQTFDPGRNELLDHTDPDYFAAQHAHPPGLGGGIGGAIDIIGDLRTLLRRAAAHDDDGVQLVGDAEVRGIPVHHLRITRTIDAKVSDGTVKDPTQAPLRKVTMVRDVYISSDENLPVRVVDHAEIGDGSAIAGSESTVDFVKAERIPLNSETAALLHMGPHPGAREVDEGPFR